MQIKNPPDELSNKLLESLSYCAGNGILNWKERPVKCHGDKVFNARYAGKRVGSADPKDRYRRVGMQHAGRKYLLLEHRVAWFLHYGEWPAKHLDHLNHDGCDNRISNLREVEPQENSRNMARSKRNKSGVTGVSYSSITGKWRAVVGSKAIGFFSDIEDAAAAVKKTRAENDYHVNHGAAK